MAAKLSTRNRILQASLQLFNTQGERNVTTNHIAAHLGISPGNLYYHFSNKQMIVAELFTDLDASIDTFFRLPPDRSVTLEDKTQYLESLLDNMWQFRFLYRDLEPLLEADPDLAERHHRFAQRSLNSATAIYQEFVEAGILQMTPQQIEALAVNAWIILNSWIRLLSTSCSDDHALDRTMLRRGIYQVLALEEGYVAPASQEAVQALFEQFYVPLEHVLSGLNTSC